MMPKKRTHSPALNDGLKINSEGYYYNSKIILKTREQFDEWLYLIFLCRRIEYSMLTFHKKIRYQEQQGAPDDNRDNIPKE